jgi:hypothetical protein
VPGSAGWDLGLVTDAWADFRCVQPVSGVKLRRIHLAA